MISGRKLDAGKLMIHLLFIIISILCLIPMVYILSASFSDESTLVKSGYQLIPEKLSLSAYNYILQSPAALINAYFISIVVTAIGTIVSLLLTAKLAYVLSRRDFRGSNALSFLVFFTLLFNGGLVPWFILIKKYLNLGDTIWALILPYLILPWHVLLMKGFLSDTPSAMIESAKIDGASEWKIFYRIIIPISTPAMATVGLLTAFVYWNDWWLAMLFIDNQQLYPLQFMLYRIMNNIQFLTSSLLSGNVSIDLNDLPSLTARMATAVLAAGPILFVFPFFQKYFVKGLTVGAIKG